MQTIYNPRGDLRKIADPDKYIKLSPDLSNIYIESENTKILQTSFIYHCNISDIKQTIDDAKTYHLQTRLPSDYFSSKIEYHDHWKQRGLLLTVTSAVAAIVLVVTFAVSYAATFPISLGTGGLIIIGSALSLAGASYCSYSDYNEQLVKKLKWETKQQHALTFERHFTQPPQYTPATLFEAIYMAGPDHYVRTFTDKEYAKLSVLMNYAAQNPDQKIYIKVGSLPKNYKNKQGKLVIPLNSGHILPLK